MKVTLKVVTPEAEKTIVEIARVSSSRDDKTENQAGLINYLITNKHWSPFEHAYMTVEIVTSKAIGIQLLRHRSFTFQEFSQRYAVVNQFELVEIRQQADKNRQSSTKVFNPEIFGINGHGTIKASKAIESAFNQIKLLYDELLASGVARECARMILPMATQTTIFMTGSVRNWIHFLQLRDDGHAQKEAQEVARAIKDIFRSQFPIISNALGWV